MLLPSIIAAVLAPQVAQVEPVLLERIGPPNGAPEARFGHVADLAADADGNVYVLDDRADAVRVFSPAGAFLRSFGRRGSSAGELNRPNHIDVRDGVVTVLNPGGRSSSFTLQGELLESETLPFGSLRAARVDGGSYAVYMSGGITRSGDPVPIESLLLVGAGATDTILTVPSSDILFRGPTSSSLLRTSLCRLANFAVGADGQLWVASGTEGTLTEWRIVDGAEPARSVALAPEAVPLPDSTRTRLLGLVPRQLSPETGELTLPPVLGSICGVERSSDGTLWLRLGDVEGREKWVAVDPTTLGPIRELSAPTGVAMSAFSGNLAYGIQLDDAGVWYVGVYRLE